MTQTLTVTKRPDNSSQPPNKKRRRRLNVLGLVLLVLLTLYVSIAAAIRYSYWVQSRLIYLHFVRTPFFADLNNPAKLGLRNTRNFDLVQHDGCAVGTWHILPDTYRDNVTCSGDFTAALSDGSPIILYLHGNTGTRGTSHRVRQYMSLSKRGYHVITFDYRGFGDSTCVPTERGMMEDGLLAWDMIRSHAPKSRVFLWGHSLGSAAATYLSKELWDRRTVYPRGVVLDAPFTSMLEAAANHPFGAPYWPVLPLFRYFVIESFHEHFDSESRLKLIPFPLLIAHGHKDIIIPFHLGHRMYETAMESRKKNPFLSRHIHFVDCGATTHKTNFESAALQSALDHFIDGK